MTERYTPQIVLFWVMVLLCGMFTACSFHDDNSSCPMYVQLKFIHNNMSSADSGFIAGKEENQILALHPAGYELPEFQQYGQ